MSRQGLKTYIHDKPPSAISYACVGGKKEGEGPKRKYFDKISDDPYFTTDSFEKAESEMQKQAIMITLRKAGLKPCDIDYILGGDLLNQCVGTSYSTRDIDIPFLGIYGACSTMAEGLLISSLLLSGGVGKLALAVTSSHFCTAERQYRFPLEYGCQRTPTAQWTATAAGAVLLSAAGNAPYIRGATIGNIVDLGVTDANNMGAAMAPAACDTIKSFFNDTKMKPSDFDLIVTGDLGFIGSKILYQLTSFEGINIKPKHKDCGLMIYDREAQDVHAGGSGCGCAASMLTGYFLPKLQSGRLNNILFVATGALMSPTINQQGESIPSVAHAVWISHSKGV